MREEWVPKLKKHCQGARKERLGSVDFRLTRVCSRHFKPGTKRHLTTEEGLESILDEYLDDYLPSDGETSRTRPLRRFAKTDPRGRKRAKRRAVEDGNGDVTSSSSDSSDLELDLSISDEDEEDISISGLLRAVADSNNFEAVETAHSDIIDSEIGSSIIIGAVCALINNFNCRASATPGALVSALKSAFQTLKSMHIDIDPKRISTMTGVSEDDLKKALKDFHEVRNILSQTGKIFSHFGDYFHASNFNLN